ncbi:hypothetical protein BGZ99_007790 [Dissophora globulifera]|uniref:Bacteriophage T5 Orf172 DNA-binding domain-containing protein n=1 Tax=Dissophora globulifera TaxID=979702 RepID=A0A9P6RB42_9FUNG|nr:hypothetical protein BGZ99_007790 [Dissophora globulifera]
MSIDTLYLENVFMGDDLDIEGIDNSDESMDQIGDDQNFVDTDNSDEFSDQSFDYQDIVDNDNSDESGFALLRNGETATRYPCSLRSCANWSPSILKVSGPVKFYCQCHYPPETPPGNDPRRFRCVVVKRDGERCPLQDYHVLYSGHKDHFRCNNHRQFCKGRFFREQRFRAKDTQLYQWRLPVSLMTASEDIVITIPSGPSRGFEFRYTGRIWDDDVLIKIGYTSKLNVSRRLSAYNWKCGMENSLVERSNNVVFAHLLEKIIHEIFKFHQVDVACACSSTHTELFRFDRAPMQDDESAFRANIAMVWTHIMMWEGAIRMLDEIYEIYQGIHRPSA